MNFLSQSSLPYKRTSDNSLSLLSAAPTELPTAEPTLVAALSLDEPARTLALHLAQHCDWCGGAVLTPDEMDRVAADLYMAEVRR